MTEAKSESKVSKSQSDEASTPQPVSSLDLETAARSKRFFKASIGPAVMGLISAALLVGVVALYTWGTTVATNSSNGSGLAQGWIAVLPVAAIVVGLVVGIGLPVLWSYKKGFARVVMVLGFEGLMLLLALLISGYFIFSSGMGTNTPAPVGCGCGAGRSAATVCMYCAN